MNIITYPPYFLPHHVHHVMIDMFEPRSRSANHWPLRGQNEPRRIATSRCSPVVTFGTHEQTHGTWNTYKHFMWNEIYELASPNKTLHSCEFNLSWKVGSPLWEGWQPPLPTYLPDKQPKISLARLFTDHFDHFFQWKSLETALSKTLRICMLWMFLDALHANQVSYKLPSLQHLLQHHQFAQRLHLNLLLPNTSARSHPQRPMLSNVDLLS